MKKFIRNIIILGAVTTFATSTVYGASTVSDKQLKQANLKQLFGNKTSTNTNNNTNTNTTETKNTSNLYTGLNTNVSDIKALSFYKTELSSDESKINSFDNLIKTVEFNQLDKPKKGDLVAVIETSEGTIKVKFLPEVAPKAVKNFVEHSLNGYYDGLTFHRVIDNFVAQGGDPLGTGTGGESVWNTAFANEVNVSARHFSGALAMANSGPKATNGSQFYFVDNVKLDESLLAELDEFKNNQDMILEHMHEEIPGEENVYHEGDIRVKDLFSSQIIESYKAIGGTPQLDFGYTVFGQTYEGLDVVDKITQVKVDKNDKPLNPVIIKKITIGIVE